jgi:hypothetical protein
MLSLDLCLESLINLNSKKMMKRFLYITILTSLWACERTRVITDIDYEPKIVAHSLFNQEFPMEIRVSKSRSILNQADTFEVANESVQVLSGGMSFELEYDTIRNLYRSKNLPAEGQEFLLIVQVPGLRSIQASSKVPSRPSGLNSFLDEGVSFDTFGVSYDQLNISFLDKAGEDNFYMLQMFYYTNRFNSYLPFKPENALNENVGLIENREGAFIFNDKGRNGKSIELKFTVPFDQATQTGTTPRYYFELSSITKEYYEYERTLSLYDNQAFNFGGLFSEPVQIYSNISQGRGIFGGKLVVRDSIP